MCHDVLVPIHEWLIKQWALAQVSNSEMSNFFSEHLCRRSLGEVARPHKGLRRDILFVGCRRKPADNTAQKKKKPFMDEN